MLYSGIDLHKRSLVIHILDGATTREAQLNSVGGAGLAYFCTFAGESTFAAFKHMFLVSDGASLITGHTVVADGGAWLAGRGAAMLEE